MPTRWLPLLLALSLLSACGGGGSSASSSSGTSGTSSTGTSTIITATALSSGGANVAGVTVGAGPSSASSNVNIPYVSVTVCSPNGSHCATINDVLVDTGSSGLRLMASVLQANGLSLNDESDSNGNSVVECLPFADGYTWGPVATVSLTVSGEHASNLPIQIIDDNPQPEFQVPSTCSSAGQSLNSVDDFSANGVLGVGLALQDCGEYCAIASASSNPPSFYYGCSSSTSCSNEAMPLSLQVVNPVSQFPTDNNGVILQMPSVGTSGSPTVSGYLAFGIGTESNNGLGNATVYATDDAGNITTIFNNRTLTSSFFDSGSNTLLFSDSAIPTCNDNSEFYCPASTLSFTATNQGANGNSGESAFNVANADSVINTKVNGAYEYAFSNLATTVSETMLSGNQSFDWGMPFFYGRTVFTAIEGQPTPGGNGPYFAY
jgi:hypothetical protein